MFPIRLNYIPLHYVHKRHTVNLVQGVVFTLHYFQQICNRSLRLFVHPCATTITLPLLVKIRFSLQLLSTFLFTLLFISIMPSPVGITAADFMSYFVYLRTLHGFPLCQHGILVVMAARPPSVCSVRALWPNGWRAGRLRPWPHCVRWGLRLEFRHWSGALPVVAGFVALD